MDRKATYEELEDRIRRLEGEIKPLESSQENLKTLLEHTEDYILISDEEGFPVIFNSAYARIMKDALGIDMKPGLKPHTLLPDREAREWWENLHRRVLGGEKFQVVYSHDFGEGDQRHLEVYFTPIIRDGKVKGFSEVTRDITERVKAAEELTESEERFRNIVESSPMGVHMYRLEGDGRLIFTGANSTATSMLGVDCDEFVGKTIEEAFPPLEKTEVPERYRRACADGVPWNTDHIEYTDGKISGAYEVYAFQTAPGKMAAFFMDVTERKQMEEEVRKVHKLESLGVLAGGIAHDFNNLLVGILGNITLAKLEAPPNSTLASWMKEAEMAADRARQLTQQLLIFSRGGSPVVEVRRLESLIRESADFTLRGSNVKWQESFDEDLWPVKIDEGQINQVVQNLVQNADHAMPGGGSLVIEARNREVAEGEIPHLPPGRYVSVAFRDHGVGIRPESVTRVFDPYYSTKNHKESSGLGLSVCYSIIKRHGGLITVDSQVDVGSTFTIYLPASREKAAGKPRNSDFVYRGQGRILVMDDEETVLATLGSILTTLGFKVETAVNGEEALAKYRAAMSEGEPFDLSIFDLTVPGGMGGREALEELKKLDPDARVVVSTGYSNEPVMSDFKEHGFTGSLSKPYRLASISAMLKNVLEPSREPRHDS